LAGDGLPQVAVSESASTRKRPPATTRQLRPEVRTEQLIAIARLLLGLTGLFMVLIDPPSVLPDVGLAELILLAYSAWAAGVMLALRMWPTRVLRHRLPVHALDLVAVAVLIIFTGRIGSPFFSLVMLPVAAATLRWQEAGAIRTGVVLLLLFLGMQLYDAAAGSLVSNTMIVRYAFLVVTILLLGEVGRLERRHARQVMRVSRWPHTLATTRAELAEELVARATVALNAPRGALAWEHPEEPWLELFSWDGRNLSQSRVPQASAEPLVVPALGAVPFLWRSGRGKPVVTYLDGEQQRVYDGHPLTRSFAQEVDAHSVLGLPLAGEHTRGYLFLLDVPDPTADDLRLAQVVGRNVSDTLENFALSEQLRAMTSAEERVRLSRDLHDGILQTLTGIALRLAAIKPSLGSTASRAHDQLRDLEQLVLDEQRDLRFFTSELRASSDLEGDGISFSEALAGLLSRVEKIWELSVRLDQHEAQLVPQTLETEVYRLVHEAVINAARHGRARNAQVRFSRDGGALRITVTDDGHGFAFHGSYSMSELIRQKRGPRSLRERVAALGGNMDIRSSSAGAEIVIGLPVNETAA
jgi:signal transduction histidine kinase